MRIPPIFNLVVLFPLIGSLHGQGAIDWTVSDDAAAWGGTGTNAFATSGGTYTRSSALINSSGNASPGYSASANQSFDGPYDGSAGIFADRNTQGAFTRTDPNAVMNLSATGASATLRTAVIAFQSNLESGPLSGHYLQFGLSNSDAIIGAVGNDSLFVGLDLNSASSNGHIDYDLNVYDESTDSDPLDGVWNWSPLVDLGGSADGLRVEVSNNTTAGADPGVMNAIELTYTNMGSNLLRLDIGVMGLDYSGRAAADTLTGTSLLFQDSVVVDLNASPLDLTALRPAFGFNFNDAVDTARAVGTGVSLDWEEQYPTGFSVAVPEPSALLLVMGSLSLIMQRRRMATVA
ncbi:MAG: hypothetical protein ACSHYB_12710 [Roseibacillus sp.]